MGIVTSLFGRIEGIYWFPVISLFIFLTVFTVMLVHTLKMKREQEDKFSRLPLADDDQNNNEAL